MMRLIGKGMTRLQPLLRRNAGGNDDVGKSITKDAILILLYFGGEGFLYLNYN
jgi:hypothetical protein